MARTANIPNIRKVDLPEVRQAIPYVHTYLRECILDGTLTPGTKLSQVTLAEQLGVSRTPLREVLRMLQEEGLVEIEPNQRTRVAGLDPQELDDIYASRILMETLALSMTVGHFGAAGRKEAKRLLATMRRAAKSGEFPVWFSAHADYHRLITDGAGPALQRQLQVFADRTIPLHPDLPAVRPEQLAGRRRRRARADPRGADRRRRARRADRDGPPPRAHRAAGADRLRAGLRAGRSAACRGADRPSPAGRAPVDRRRLSGALWAAPVRAQGTAGRRRGSRRSSRSSSSGRSRR